MGLSAHTHQPFNLDGVFATDAHGVQSAAHEGFAGLQIKNSIFSVQYFRGSNFIPSADIVTTRR